MLEIICPTYCKEELAYSLDLVLHDRLGLDYKVKYSPSEKLLIEYQEKSLSLNLNFFSNLDKSGIVETSEIIKLNNWNRKSVSWKIHMTQDEIPVIFGEPKIDHGPNDIHIGIDILGAVFFMLTRYEELNSNKLDHYNRFPATESLAYRTGFLMRPIVDEYIEILWAGMKELWPELVRKEESFKIVPTHDVDRPFLNIGLINFKALTQRLGGDLIKRKNLVAMLKTFHGWIKYKIDGNIRYKNDPYDVFDRLIEISDKRNIKNKFYFMSTKENIGVTGGRYDISSEAIKSLIIELSRNGHEIGLHPTGNSFNDKAAFKLQADTYFTLKKELNIESISGGRQHYLLWNPYITPMNWQEAGFQYDSTLAYADHVGFRCGTCKEYYLWNHEKKQKMKLLEQPLIMMEGSLLSSKSMGMNYIEAKDVILQLKKACKTVNGNFIFLWHNSSFEREEDWSLYKLCLEEI